jgi:hypothetical protein
MTATDSAPDRAAEKAPEKAAAPDVTDDVKTDRVIPAQRAGAPGALRGPVAAAAPEVGPRPWWQAGRQGGLVWLATHLGYLAILLVSRMTDKVWIGIPAALKTFRQQDTNWYWMIASHGYERYFEQTGDPTAGTGRIVAFFPAYPLLTRVLNPVLPGGTEAALFIVSNLALLGALVVFYRLVDREFDGATARRAIWYLMLFPTAFFLVAGYSTSLFLLLTIGAVYAMRSGHFWLAGLLGALATATRQSALLLGVVFLWEYWRQRDTRGKLLKLDVLAVALIPTGLLAFMLYLYETTGDALAFAHAQSSWIRVTEPPWVGLYHAVRVFVRVAIVNNQNNTLELGSVLLMLALCGLALVGPWKLRRDQFVYPVYGILLVIFFLCFPTAKPYQPLMSISRFVLEVFPGFMILARFGRHPLVDKTFTFGAVGVQSALLVFFLHGGWVA